LHLYYHAEGFFIKKWREHYSYKYGIGVEIMNLMNFKVNAVSEGGMKTVVNAGKFKIIVDEPESMGGTNEGTSPVELILAALAGCYTVVGNLAARELGFELRGIQTEIEGSLNPARFAGQSYDERAGFQNINIKVKPDSNADTETLEKWIGMIENRCPVTDNLTNRTPLNVSLG